MGLDSRLYTKRNLTIIRLISFLTIIILTISIFKIIIKGEAFNTPKEIFTTTYGTLFINIFCIICAGILIFHPEKIIIISIVSFLYSITIFIDEPQNNMGILMCILCYCTLQIRNFFHSYKRLKIILLSFMYFCSLLLEIRFGFNVFLSSLFTKTAFLLVICIILFFFKENFILESNRLLKDKKLNIFPYPGTKEDDVKLLQLVLEKKQYLEISQAVYRSEGTIRNRLNKLYDILGVADKIGFITTYNGYKVIYDDTELEEIANNN